MASGLHAFSYTIVVVLAAMGKMNAQEYNATEDFMEVSAIYMKSTLDADQTKTTNVYIYDDDDDETETNDFEFDSLAHGDLLWYFIGALIASSLCFAALCLYIHFKTKEVEQNTKNPMVAAVTSAKRKKLKKIHIPNTSENSLKTHRTLASNDTVSSYKSLISVGSVAPMEEDIDTEYNESVAHTSTAPSGRSFSEEASQMSEDSESFIFEAAQRQRQHHHQQQQQLQPHQESFAAPSNLYMYNPAQPIPEVNEEGTVSMSSIHSMNSILSFVEKNQSNNGSQLMTVDKNVSKSLDTPSPATVSNMTYMTASTAFSFNDVEISNCIEQYDDNHSIDDEKSFDDESQSVSITHEDNEPICCNVTVIDGNPSWINKSKKNSHSNSDETSSWVSNIEHEQMIESAKYRVHNSLHVNCETGGGTSTEYDSTTSSLDSAMDRQFEV